MATAVVEVPALGAQQCPDPSLAASLEVVAFSAEIVQSTQNFVTGRAIAGRHWCWLRPGFGAARGCQSRVRRTVSGRTVFSGRTIRSGRTGTRWCARCIGWAGRGRRSRSRALCRGSGRRCTPRATGRLVARVLDGGVQRIEGAAGLGTLVANLSPREVRQVVTGQCNQIGEVDQDLLAVPITTDSPSILLWAVAYDGANPQVPFGL